MRRTAARIIGGEPVCNGNRESLRQALSRDSIILWHFRSFTSRHRRMRSWVTDPAVPPTILFRSPASLDSWLAAADLG